MDVDALVLSSPRDSSQHSSQRVRVHVHGGGVSEADGGVFTNPQSLHVVDLWSWLDTQDCTQHRTAAHAPHGELGCRHRPQAGKLPSCLLLHCSKQHPCSQRKYATPCLLLLQDAGIMKRFNAVNLYSVRTITAEV